MKQSSTQKAVDNTKPRTPIGIIEILSAKYARLAEAQDRVSKEGLVVRDQKGSVIPHPCIKLAQETEKEIIEILKVYGS